MDRSETSGGRILRSIVLKGKGTRPTILQCIDDDDDDDDDDDNDDDDVVRVELIKHALKQDSHKMAAAAGTGDGPSNQEQADSVEAGEFSTQKCIQSLNHACQCHEANCTVSGCIQMKRVIEHTKICGCRNSADGCEICKQLIALMCHHAKACQETKCTVPFCLNTKHKLKQQQLQQRFQQVRLLRQQMAAMSNIWAAAPSDACSKNSIDGA
ncbi:CREB binding protein [Gryllus bimaculatus]|nr:CREB binding protein [Gryllus bimaculatus]